MMRRMTPVAASVLLALLAGCSLMPAYQTPASPVAAQWPAGPAYQQLPAATRSEGELPGWPQFFTDARLQQLIRVALAENRDLRVATLNVEAARAQYQIQSSAQWPTLALAGSGTAKRTSANAGNGKAVISHSDSLSVGISSYELDLFGRVASLKEQALQSYLAEEATQHSARLTLVAEVASAYLTLQADQQRLALAEKTLATQQASYQLTERMLAAGAATRQDLYAASSAVQSANIDVASYTAQVAQDRNALALLLGGQLPEDALQQQALADMTPLAEVPAGLPSALLQRRPDIVASEHALQAANANIGAARAKFFPSISLTANAGLASSNLSGLFKAGAGAWQFSPSVSLPLLDGGSLQAGVDSARVAYQSAVASYDKTVQTAFREVADALAVRGTMRSQLAAQQALVDSSRQTFAQVEARFKAGADSYLTVLTAQRSLYAAEQALISLQLSDANNRITLYKVLGGGWQPDAASAG